MNRPGRGLGERSGIVSLSSILERGAPAESGVGEMYEKKNARALIGGPIARVQRMVAQGNREPMWYTHGRGHAPQEESNLRK